jgi:hypothetical protein
MYTCNISHGGSAARASFQVENIFDVICYVSQVDLILNIDIDVGAL